MVGRRLALVDDRPGVTRDRREGEGGLGDIEFTGVDTAGFEESAPESLSGRMRAQTEAAIDQARMENRTGHLVSAEKDPLNTLIRSYNVARDSWLTYRGAIATNVPADAYFQQLTRNLTDLAGAMRAFDNEKEVKK